MVAWSVVVREFGSDRCACGAQKTVRCYFCKSCYFELPDPYRRRLWIPWARLSQNAICTLYTRCLSRLGLLNGRAV